MSGTGIPRFLLARFGPNFSCTSGNEGALLQYGMYVMKIGEEKVYASFLYLYLTTVGVKALSQPDG